VLGSHTNAELSAIIRDNQTLSLSLSLSLSLKEKAPLDVQYILWIPGFCISQSSGPKIVPNGVTTPALSYSL